MSGIGSGAGFSSGIGSGAQIIIDDGTGSGAGVHEFNIGHGGIGSGAGIGGGIGIGGGAAYNSEQSLETGLFDIQLPATFPVNFSHNRLVRIVAEVDENAIINLKDNDEIPLHFNVRFNEHAVVRNNLSNGHWGHEERNGGLPFNRHQLYTIDFDVVDSFGGSSIRVKVNGNPFTVFKVRGDIGDINAVEIERGFKVHSVQIV